MLIFEKNNCFSDNFVIFAPQNLIFVRFMSNSNTFVGSKIKGLRETKNLSLEEIAERSGLTVEQITSIENDQNLPSLGPLIKIARALGVRLGTFMDDNDALGPIVTRAKDREADSSISFSNGATDARKHMEYHPLAQQKAGRHMEPFVIDINPEETPNFQLSDHEGEEFIYVMQGEVEIVYGKETYNLKEGDSIFYDSIVKHHVHGAPGKSAKILAVVYIPF
jgi:transcriptional regulator with XRE-family HTH domain